MNLGVRILLLTLGILGADVGQGVSIHDMKTATASRGEKLESSKSAKGGYAVVAAVKACKEAAQVHLSTVQLEMHQVQEQFAEQVKTREAVESSKAKENGNLMDCVQVNQNISNAASKRKSELQVKKIELQKALVNAKKAMQMKREAKDSFQVELKGWNERLQGESEARVKSVSEAQQRTIKELAKLPEIVTGNLMKVVTFLEVGSESDKPAIDPNPDISALPLSSMVVRHESLVSPDAESNDDYMNKLLRRAFNNDIEAGSFDYIYGSLASLLNKYHDASKLLPTGHSVMDTHAAFSDIQQTLSRLDLSIKEQEDKINAATQSLKSCGNDAKVTAAQLKLAKEALARMEKRQATSLAFYESKLKAIKDEIQFATESIQWMTEKLGSQAADSKRQAV